MATPKSSSGITVKAGPGPVAPPGPVLMITSSEFDTPAGVAAGSGLPRIGILQMSAADLKGRSAVVIDVDLRQPTIVSKLRNLIAATPTPPRLYFGVERDRQLHLLSTQANALGATGVIERPLTPSRIKAALASLPEAASGSDALARLAEGRSIEAAGQAIGDSFVALATGRPVAVEAVVSASRELFSGLGHVGLERWLDTVRAHHAGTFQHCLLVTGAAVAYAETAKMPETVRMTLAVAALLHDIGKAQIPNQILDKPSALTPREFAVIKAHPRIGAEALARQPGLSPAIIDAVLHHHEYLDGSGYPDGLKGSEIGLLTRIMTVCDVYGALVEERAYKPAKSQSEALYILIGMAKHGKVDMSVVRQLAAAIGIALPEEATA